MEREHKLLVPPNVRIPPPDELLDGMGEWTVEELDHEARYFDTSDLRLTRAGVSLRYRSDDGWTVKLPDRKHHSELDRDEIGFQGPIGRPPQAAVNLVRAWARAARLRTVLTIRTRRTKVTLVNAGGEPLLELDDDSVAAAGPRVERPNFREVEVEIRDGTDPDLAKTVVERLLAAGADATDSMAKIARALGEPGQAPPDLPALGKLPRRATVDELVRYSITASTARLLQHDPLIRLSNDSEAVHQARVATRRLRSDLRTLGPLIEESWANHLRSELTWLGEALGRVRDNDVLGMLLAAKSARLPDNDRSRGIADLLDRITGTGEHERDHLLQVLSSRRYALLTEELVTGAASPHLRAEVRGKKARPRAQRLAHKAWRRVRKKVEQLPAHPMPEDLHALRKRAKQGRYALELLTPIVGETASNTAEALEEMQEVLGDHHDAVVATGWLHDAAGDSGVEDAFVAGTLAGVLAGDQDELASEWAGAWRRARHRGSGL
jgi:CHAD domain-containing protein